MSQNAESDLLAKCTLTFQDVENAAGSGDDVWLLESQTLETPNDEGGLANAAELGGTGTPNPTALKLPARDATVDEVREYIVATLVTSHETSAEFAHKTALKWNLGRGWCLLDLPSARFTEIFGLVGPHLEWDVRDGKEKEIRARRAELQPAKDAVSRRVRALMGIGLVLAIAAYTFTEKFHYGMLVLVAFQGCILFNLSDGESIAFGTILLLVMVFFTCIFAAASFSSPEHARCPPCNSIANVSTTGH